MAPTKRKKPEKQPQQPKRPSVAKKGRAAAPVAGAEASPASQEAQVGQVTPKAGLGKAAGEKAQAKGLRGRLRRGLRAGKVPQDSVAVADAVDDAQGAADATVSAFDEFATVDLADGALYSGSELSVEDVSQQEDRVGEDPLAAREARRAGEAPASGDTADGLLPRNAVSAVWGANAAGDSRLASHGGETADMAAGSAGGAEYAGAATAGADGGATNSIPAAAEGLSAEASAAGPAEITDEERAAFYSAVPLQRPEEPEGKGSKRLKRKGKVAAAKTPVGRRGNPRAGAADKGTAAKRDGSVASKAKGTASRRKVSVGFVVKVVIVAVLVLAVALSVAAVVAFNQVRNGGNDAQDFQGTWYLNGTNVPVEVTADEIVLTSDVAYSYQLDAADKTIQLKFGNLEGGGSYLFSLNRQQLMIVDGETGGEELLPDFFWTVQALLAQVRGDDEYPLPQMENATYLNRAPAPGKAVTDATTAGNGLLANGEGSANGDSPSGGEGDKANDSGSSGAGSDDAADSGNGNSNNGE